MNKKIAATLLAALALSACGPSADKRAAAADAKAAGFTPPAVTSRLDFGSAMDRRFRTLDRNADDRITRDEWPRRNARLAELDRNADGVVTTTEWSEGVLRRFDQMDLNHDGTLTSEEQDASRAARKAGRAPLAEPTAPVVGDPLANGTALR